MCELHSSLFVSHIFQPHLFFFLNKLHCSPKHTFPLACRVSVICFVWIALHLHGAWLWVMPWCTGTVLQTGSTSAPRGRGREAGVEGIAVNVYDGLASLSASGFFFFSIFWKEHNCFFSSKLKKKSLCCNEQCGSIFKSPFKERLGAEINQLFNLGASPSLACCCILRTLMIFYIVWVAF